MLTVAVTPSPPSHGPTEAATMVVRVGDGRLAVAVGFALGERAVLVEWQMARIR